MSENASELNDGVSNNQVSITRIIDLDINSDSNEESNEEFYDTSAKTYGVEVINDVMKTSNRIIEDIRFALYFLEDTDAKFSLLKSKTVDYSKKLATLDKIPYQILCSSDSETCFSAINSFSSPNGTIQIIRALLVNDIDSIDQNLSHIHHLTLKVKRNAGSDSAGILEKQQFFLIKDQALSSTDSKDLLWSNHTNTSDSFVETLKNLILDNEDYPDFETKISTLKKSVPQVLDSATFISLDSQIIINVEISKQELDFEFVKQFEPESTKKKGISMPFKKSKSTSTIDCMNTLLSTLKTGIRTESQDVIKIDSDSHGFVKSSIIPTSVLDKYFNCTTFAKKNCSVLVNHHHYNDPLIQQSVKEYMIRLSLEVDYWLFKHAELSQINHIEGAGGITSHKSKPDAHLHDFKKRISVFYRCLKEDDLAESLNYESCYENLNFTLNSSTLSYKSEDLIKLSAFEFYDARSVIKNYRVLKQIDPSNVPVYFQSFQNICNAKMTYKEQFLEDELQYQELSTFLGTELSLGILTAEQILDSFRLLGFSANVDEAVETQQNDYSKMLKSLSQIPEDSIIMAYRYQVKSDPNKRVQFTNELINLAKFKNSTLLQRFVESEYIPLHECYNALGISDTVDDDTVLIAYQFKIKDLPASDSAILNKSLISMGSYRRSAKLLNYTELNLLAEICWLVPKLYYGQTISEEECYGYLGVKKESSDFILLTSIDSQFKEIDLRISSRPPVDSAQNFEDFDLIRKLRLYLQKLNYYRGSRIVHSYLETGIIHPSSFPLDRWPTGLDNIGNTCYLNSLLQFYFVIKPLRDAVINFKKLYPSDFELEITSSAKFSKRRIGGRTVKGKEVERSYQFVYHLRDLFNNMINANTKWITPKKELAYLAFSPITQEVDFEKANGTKRRYSDYEDAGAAKPVSKIAGDVRLVTGEDKKSEIKEDEIEQEAISISAEEIDSEKEFGDSESDSADEELASVNQLEPALANISFDQMENALEMGRQQDVTECIENVIFQLEAAVDPIDLEEDGEQYDHIKKLFYGKTKQTLEPLNNPSRRRSKTERFSSLLVNVGDNLKDIYDALDDFFADDIMSLSEDGDVKRSLVITDLPDILQVQIQRVQYDLKRGIAFKNIKPLVFSDKLYLDRYMETDDIQLKTHKEQALEFKKEMNELKKRLDVLTKKDDTGLTIKDSLVATKKFLESDSLKSHPHIVVKPETLKFLQEHIEKITKDIEDTSNRIHKLEVILHNLFDNYKTNGYDLFAIFIHRGQASYGHYWIYIKDPQNNVWRKYNDETVTEVPVEEVFNFMEGNTATPYFVVYVKEDMFHEAIEPLKRVVAY